MTALSIVLDIFLILISLVLIVAVLMQQGQRQGLGSIAGGAETFFGKGKAKGIDAKLAKITKIAAVCFIVLAIAATIVVAHDTKSSAPTVNINDVIAAVDAENDEEEAEVEEPAEDEAEAPAEDADEQPAEDAAEE